MPNTTATANPADAVREAPLIAWLREESRRVKSIGIDSTADRLFDAAEMLAALTARADNAEAQIRDAWRELSCSDDISALLIAEGINQLQRAREQAEARLAALAGAAPDWVTVPRTVTREMLIAYWNSDCEGDPAVTDSLLTDGDLAVLQRDWNAMIAAAPHAPAKAREDGRYDLGEISEACADAGLNYETFDQIAIALEDRRAALATFAEGAE